MIWIIAVAATVTIIAVVTFAMFSKRKKHWQVGYKTLRPDMLPKREKKAQSQNTSADSTPIWGSYSEPKKEEAPQQNSWASWNTKNTENTGESEKDKASDDTPIIPPGMFDW